ncbi:tripartite tricarboxylate transporter substrate binding protein [Roseomonas eburnea]|uniref:Tripartite tricarboxylate transporter substrate binding protein n=1 Tax=Neoroseomonas eburnea TaxID=1346889 RepID=A0A9X9XH16_9PROT|nr:tripartite tricarboxylate transporter substrate-binding protein [Neoroseomonas eburnea]MBR0683002.1 tripartite tricarboxylate transporter substrate binding protein [Neoroseomonas eburnea]
MPLARRTTLAAALAGAAPALAFAQPRAWPNRPVRIVIPYAPGGPVEIPGRFIAEHLAARLGQPFVVETRPGAGGALGTKQVIAATDQHTLLMVTGAVAIQPAVQPDIGYDPVNELVPISVVSESSMGFMVRPNAAFRDLAGLIAAAKAAPGRITYGSSGNGTTTHMAAALFGARAGIAWQHVPYRGSGQLISGFLAGDVDVMSGDLATLLPHVREGRGRLLGVTSPERVPAVPDVPSIAEVVPGTGITIWFALFAPRGFPEEAVARLGAELAPLRGGSPLGERMAAAGGRLLLTGPAELSERLRRELPLWRQVVADAGIRAE